MTQCVTRIAETNLNIFSVPSEAKGASPWKVYKFVARVDCTARQKLQYRSLGCPQLTSSSFDVRVHFRVARQRYFKCECKCYALSCFIQKCVSLFNRLFTVKTLLFPKICTFVHQGIPTTNWFCPRRSMLLIDQIKDWFQLRTSIRR